MHADGCADGRANGGEFTVRPAEEASEEVCVKVCLNTGVWQNENSPRTVRPAEEASDERPEPAAAAAAARVEEGPCSARIRLEAHVESAADGARERCDELWVLEVGQQRRRVDSLAAGEGCRL